MATISRVVFAVSWTTTYRPLLASANGRLVTRDGYTSAFNALGAEFGLPWEGTQGAGHWSRFWSSYLASPGKVRRLDVDAAWDRIVPFRWTRTSTVSGPVGADAHADVLVYPSAITVIIRIDATGEWLLDGLASSVATMRDGTHWSLTTPRSVSSHRNLDGIAADLRDDAATLLTDGHPLDPDQQTEQTVLTVAAPTAGEGDAASFELTDKTASSCLAGLAVLGPPGPLIDTHLLEANSDTRRAGRVYALRDGHAIWHPTHIVQQPEGDPIGCLHRNHTDLVAHIAALAGVVSWAGEQVATHVAIPVTVQPLVQRAVLRLDQLHAGTSAKTYRSGIAKARIEPLLDTLRAVRSAL